MQKKLLLLLFCFVFFAGFSPLWPQAPENDELLSFVGLKLDDLIMRFGIPQNVYAVRGDEVWQDDVVFSYREGDFYIYRDRVWQIGLKSAMGIKTGDSKELGLLILGDKTQDEGDFLLYPLPAEGWPLSLRINLTAGKISAIFVYRPDF